MNYELTYCTALNHTQGKQKCVLKNANSNLKLVYNNTTSNDLIGISAPSFLHSGGKMNL